LRDIHLELICALLALASILNKNRQSENLKAPFDQSEFLGHSRFPGGIKADTETKVGVKLSYIVYTCGGELFLSRE
jgi:hypothetical protein